MSDISKNSARHLLVGIATYITWGLFPLYFVHLKTATAPEVISHRALWGLLFCVAVLLVTRRWNEFYRTVRVRKVRVRLGIAGILIVANWTTYIYAIITDRTIDAALGYFINPLLTVALARIVLGERASRSQKIALTLGGLAVLVLVFGLGHFPWIALVLALTFGLYSLVKKDVAMRISAVGGMTMETAAVSPFLALYLLILTYRGQTSVQILADTSGQHAAIVQLALLIGGGILTVIPLITYAYSAQGLTLTAMGLMQYVGPVIQLIIGVYVFHEPMETARWIGTGIVWAALVFLAVDAIHSQHTRRRMRASLRATAVDPGKEPV